MSITVKFFARLREQTGMDEVSLPFAENMDVAQVWGLVAVGQMLPDNTLCAINMEYVNLHAVVKDDDEVAFFPPVTGG